MWINNVWKCFPVYKVLCEQDGFGLHCFDGKCSLAGLEVSSHYRDPKIRGEWFNAASQMDTFYSRAVDPKPVAQDGAAHEKAPRALVHRKTQNRTPRMWTALASSNCILRSTVSATPSVLLTVSLEDWKGQEWAGFKGPGDQCPGRDRKDERGLSWRSVDSRDISHRFSIQRGSCFWKVPPSSKVEFCFSKGPQADIPFFFFFV